MTTENIDIKNGEGMQTDATEANIEATPTPEEIQAKLKELEGFNARLLQENKELKKASTKEETAKGEPKEETKQEEQLDKDGFSLRDIAEISKLNQEYSIEELEKAKGFIGTLGNSLTEVANNVGFKAVIAKEREENKSNEMIEETNMDLKPIETKESIIRDIEAGVIDYKKPGNEKYKAIYVKHLASQMD